MKYRVVWLSRVRAEFETRIEAEKFTLEHGGDIEVLKDNVRARVEERNA